MMTAVKHLGLLEDQPSKQLPGSRTPGLLPPGGVDPNKENLPESSCQEAAQC